MTVQRTNLTKAAKSKTSGCWERETLSVLAVARVRADGEHEVCDDLGCWIQQHHVVCGCRNEKLTPCFCAVMNWASTLLVADRADAATIC